MNSDFIKLQLMKFLRYDRGYTFVCSEAINKSDISAINEKHLLEIEVKISKQDFLKEFDGKSRNKTNKHAIYQGSKKPNKYFICPNYYYFCVTPSLMNFVKDYLKENGYNNYGIMVCEEYRIYGQKSNIRVFKKAKSIHSTPPSISVLHKIGKRVQSELITLKQKLTKNKK